MRRTRRQHPGRRRHRRAERRPRSFRSRSVGGGHAELGDYAECGQQLPRAICAASLQLSGHDRPARLQHPQRPRTGPQLRNQRPALRDRVRSFPTPSRGLRAPLAKFGFDGNYLSSLENFPGFMPVRSLVPGGAIGSLLPREFCRVLSTPITAPTATIPGTLLTPRPPRAPCPGDNGIVFMYAGIRFRHRQRLLRLHALAAPRRSRRPIRSVERRSPNRLGQCLSAASSFNTFSQHDRPRLLGLSPRISGGSPPS